MGLTVQVSMCDFGKRTPVGSRSYPQLPRFFALSLWNQGPDFFNHIRPVCLKSFVKDRCAHIAALEMLFEIFMSLKLIRILFMFTRRKIAVHSEIVDGRLQFTPILWSGHLIPIFRMSGHLIIQMTLHVKYGYLTFLNYGLIHAWKRKILPCHWQNGLPV